MIHCQPKKSTYFSLSIVVVILFAGLIFIMQDFAKSRSFGLVFYLISTSLLTVVLLMLLVKMMASYKFISAGKDQISVRIPLKGSTKIYQIDQLKVWNEEKVITNKKEFKQLTIVFEDLNSISLSNHEHLNYEELVNYLKKRAGAKFLKKKN
jgi:hypothetical protein